MYSVTNSVSLSCSKLNKELNVKHASTRRRTSSLAARCARERQRRSSSTGPASSWESPCQTNTCMYHMYLFMRACESQTNTCTCARERERACIPNRKSIYVYTYCLEYMCERESLWESPRQTNTCTHVRAWDHVRESACERVIECTCVRGRQSPTKNLSSSACPYSRKNTTNQRKRSNLSSRKVLLTSSWRMSLTVVCP